MGLESATYISDLNEAWPLGSDPKSTLDNHHRLTKAAIKTTFPNVTGAVTPTHTELNYVDGVTSAIQTQIDAKFDKAGGTITGDATISGTLGVTGALSGTTGAFSGAVTGTTATAGDNSTKFATTAYVQTTAFSSALPDQTGNSGKFVTTNGTAASWGLVPLTSAVSGVLPVANGGTGLGTLTSGSLIIGAGTSTPTFLAPGSNGNIAVVAGGVWTSAAPAGGAGLVCLSSQTVSVAVSSVDFTSLITSTYDEYIIEVLNAVPASDSTFLLRTSTNNGSSFDSGASDYSYQFGFTQTGATTAGGSVSTGTTSIPISLSVDTSATTAGGGWCGTIRIYNPLGTTHNKIVVFDGTYSRNGSSTYVQVHGGGQRLATADVDALRLFFDSGNVASGLFKLYGVRKAP